MLIYKSGGGAGASLVCVGGGDDLREVRMRVYVDGLCMCVCVLRTRSWVFILFLYIKPCASSSIEKPFVYMVCVVVVVYA